MNRPEWLPNHPRHEGAVLAFVVVAVVGYAMLTIYAWGGAFAG